jgi:hypothetical protein
MGISGWYAFCKNEYSGAPCIGKNRICTFSSLWKLVETHTLKYEKKAFHREQMYKSIFKAVWWMNRWKKWKTTGFLPHGRQKAGFSTNRWLKMLKSAQKIPIFKRMSTSKK